MLSAGFDSTEGLHTSDGLWLAAACWLICDASLVEEELADIAPAPKPMPPSNPRPARPVPTHASGLRPYQLPNDSPWAGGTTGSGLGNGWTMGGATGGATGGGTGTGTGTGGATGGGAPPPITSGALAVPPALTSTLAAALRPWSVAKTACVPGLTKTG